MPSSLLAFVIVLVATAAVALFLWVLQKLDDAGHTAPVVNAVHRGTVALRNQIQQLV